MIRENDAVDVIAMFRSHGIEIYIDGGWGVDALVGFESRIHNDIDIFINERDRESAVSVLRDNGYSEIVMEYTTINHTVWHDCNDRIIDLHLFDCDSADNLVFDGVTFPREIFSGSGRIGNREVACVTSEWQVKFHSGYELDSDDIRDVLLLCQRFNLPVPDEITDKISISTTRLILRRWSDEDAESLYKYACDARVSEMALWPRHTSVEMSRQVIRDYFRPNPFTFAMVLKESGEPIGCIGLVPAGDEHFISIAKEREAGYWIGRAYWNKGITTEALTALIEFCKDMLYLGSLLITTDANNHASQRVAEKCGFELIGDYVYEGIDSRAYRIEL